MKDNENFKMKQGEFIVEYDHNGYLHNLRNKDDSYEMNWVQGTVLWGTVKVPDTIAIERNHWFGENGNLIEEYILSNNSDFPIYLKEGDVGVYTTFNDDYEETDECMKRRCHTHIWCGLDASYVMALRMGGEGRNLGLRMLEGGLKSYSIERDEKKISNDRGDFILHPSLHYMAPGESYTLRWELFWFDDKDEFYHKLIESGNFPVVRSKQFTYCIGEKAELEIIIKDNLYIKDIKICCNDSVIPVVLENNGPYTLVKGSFLINKMQEYKIDIEYGNKRTKACIWGCEELENLIKKRCMFIAENQQETADELDGAFLIYDKEEQNRYYSHLDDHNAGRERLVMGVLIALYLQDHENDSLHNSLEKHTSFIYRELFDENTGDVCNDIHHNLDWDRLYNYPWMAVYFMEVYKYKKDKKYILDAYKCMKEYYKKGGDVFYAIGIPAIELIHCLEQEGLKTEEILLREMFLRHADKIASVGLHYPESEVNYEQSIVSPAVSILLQAYQLTGNKKYFIESTKHIKVLELFNGRQPDYHLHENAIRHWDGYWFGKRRNYGDTFPHYWSVLTGVEYARMAEVIEKTLDLEHNKTHKNDKYRSMAAASLRGCLNLFDEGGMASCAMVYPAFVNGKQTHYYDPWANDQDWALYYAWKFKKYLGDYKGV